MGTLTNEKLMFETLKRLRLLGKGKEGNVWLVESQDGKQFALKVLQGQTDRSKLLKLKSEFIRMNTIKCK